MPPKKKAAKPKNGAATPPPAYEWKPGMGVGARVRFERNTHPGNYDVDKAFNGREGTIRVARISADDGLPECELRLDDNKGVAMVHPDDCAVLLAAGAERAEVVEALEATAAGEPLPKEPFQMGEEVRDCPVPLPTDVLLAKGRRIATIALDIKALEDKLAAQKQLAKDLIAGLEGERSVLEAEVRDGAEMKPTACEWIGDPTHMRKVCRRKDTGAVVEEATLTVAECQDAFDFDDDGLSDPIASQLDSDEDEAHASAH